MESLQSLGINPSSFLGFAVASLLSWLWADGAIQALYARRFRELTEGNPDQTPRAAQATSELWREIGSGFRKTHGPHQAHLLH